ncbi:Sacsin [Sesbania bispinosa]|nr:Sacsin [Sesbania bispinosa]
MEVERMGRAQFYKQHIFNRVGELQAEDVSIRDLLRNLKFIPTLTGALKCPSVLYDPRNEELYALLEDSDTFPSGAFRESETLDILLGLGLRTSVSPETVLESARCIEHLMHEDQQKAYLRGKVLFSYLEVNALKWLPDQVDDNKGAVNRMLSRAATAFRSRNGKSDLEKFWSDLRLISWCPVLVSTPFHSLPWPVVSSMVAPPKLVRPPNDLWLVSASMRILDGMIGSDEIEIVKAVLEGCRWIWVGDGFATSDEVVLDGPLHLAPYIRVIPVDLAVFKNLFLELGWKIEKDHLLLTQEIRAVTLIVHHLAEVYLHDQKVQLYLPDVSGRLFLAGDLVYNDAPWLLGSEDPDGSFGNASTLGWNAKRTVHKFVHGNISNDVAEKLGVCSLRRMLLAESADSMNFGLSGAAEAFGQHEALTTRLKHILEMYADGPGTLFELYGTSSILSPEMADWQGPALYCYNDSVFTPQDLYAISRIGQENIPMFVSGENIVMFDPHANNLPGISPSHPGLRIKFVGRQILEQFPDQFSSLLHFGCDLQRPFPGTLFRFPLRTAGVASRSQIKKEVYTAEDIRSLFAAFSEEGTGHEMHLLHRVRRTCIGESEIGSTEAQDVFNFFKENRHVGMNRVQFLKKLSLSISRDLPYKCQKILITEQSTSGHNSHYWITTECLGGGKTQKDTSEASNSNCHNFVPWACVAAYLNSVKLGGDLVCSSDVEDDCLVSPDLFQIASLPTRPLENFEGRAFCFLPLPISTGLPAHVNAYFELSSNRRDIWFGSDMTGGGRKKRSDWNIYLLENVVAPAYGRLLEKVASEIGPCNLFFSLWPTTLGLEPWASVVRKFYQFVAEFNLRVLYTDARGGQWISTKHAIFPDFTFPKATELIKALSEWQHASQVSWTPGINGQPSLEWLQLLWNYLKNYCDDLLMFSKWPILPVGDDYLMQLIPNLNVIKNDGWSEKMSSLLLKVGCLFLRNDLQLDHPKLECFVQSPTARGVLNVFLAIAGEPQKIEGIFTDVSEGELHELRSFILQSKWFSEGQIDNMHIEIIKHLPIFESYKSRKLVSLIKPIKWLGPTGVREDLLNDSFIRTESEMERVIMRRYLEIKEPMKVEFYKDHIFNRMSEFLSEQEVVSSILNDVQLLIKEDISLKSSLSAVPFVLAANGSWQQPSRLYDPRIPQLKKMLHGDVFFPSEKFLDTEILDTLVCLGLRTTLGFTGLLDCARSVNLLHDSGDTEASKHGRELLVSLDTLALKLSNKGESNNGDQWDSIAVGSSSIMDGAVVYDGLPRVENSLIDDIDSFVISPLHDMAEEEFWSELKLISWCPVISDPAVRGLPWLKSSNHVASPTVVRPISQMWMVSSSMLILDGECKTTYLQTKLGWMDCPKVGVLSRQLIELSKSYQQLKTHSLLDPGFHAQLQKEIPCLYLKLQEYINTDDFSELKAGLDGVSWVWIGDDFVSPNALAFDSPVKFTPYLYVVPSELSEFKDLMINLGVRLSFGISDYLHVLQRLQNDVHGVPLSVDQLNFVRCVLEAIAECCLEKPLSEPFDSPLLIPDAFGVLMHAGDLVYNDAPWLDNSSLSGRHFVHPSISIDLAERLGVQSVRCLSLVSEDMTKDLPCMDYNKVFNPNGATQLQVESWANLVATGSSHGNNSAQAGEFQGPALVAIFEGACLSREEFSNFQLLPPWKLRGNTLNYGLGLVCCYSICDLLSVVSGGYFYMFDPRGLVLAAPSTNAPSAKMFSLRGTDLTQRFCDQFSPMLINQNDLWSLSDSTIIRMPLSLDCLKVGPDFGSNRIRHITDIFMEQGSRALLFLKSVLQVTISTWEEGQSHPCQNFSISIDPSSSIMRNPFSEKKWRKFQLSRLFSSSNAAIKMHVIDVSLYSEGTTMIDRWLLVLSLGSGQTRNMALDRRYLAYNLTPVAGIAALISRNGRHANVYAMSSVMTPLPLSGCINLPVTVLGCFLVCHNRGRYLSKYQDRGDSAEGHFDAGNQLLESWNRELMSCVCDSYVEMVLEIQKLRRDASSSIIDSSACSAINLALKAYGDQIYSFWPHSSERHAPSDQLGDDNNTPSSSTTVPKADWECLKERVIHPFYSRIVDLPVWQLYSGNLVKAEEGMFLSQPGNGMIGSLLPATVCSFVKEHYPVFSVPWELVTEIQAVGFSVREIRPKMVRDLLKVSSKSIVLRSVDMYIDVLEYCLSDFQQTGTSSLPSDNPPVDPANTNVFGRETDVRSTSSQPESNIHSSTGIATQGGASSGDALEMMTSLGKALFDFGRGVVEDIGRAPLAYKSAVTGIGQNRDPKFISIAAELKGLPCPTATSHLKKLGLTELWIGNKEQQSLMVPLGEKFVHPKVLDRPLLSDIFSNLSLQALLKLQNFSLNLLANHMKLIFHEDWVNHVMGSNMAPWLSWEKLPSSGSQGGPSPEWIRIFWKSFRGSQEELSLFSDWPLIPAFLGRPVLCRVRERHLVFIPPPLEQPTLTSGISERESTEDLLKPMELFDPADAILISIFFGERKKFPGERFSTDGWLRILRKLGLRTATEVDVIIECAKRVEFLGMECMKSDDLDDFEADMANSRSEVSPEVWALGGSVVEFVFSNFALFFSNNFCDLLGKVACVPAELGFPSVGCKRVLASYSEAILSKDWPLAWSCAPILSKQHTVPPEYSWGALHLRSPPSFSTVLKHLQVIGKNGGDDTLAHWPIASGLNIEECTCEILKYLAKIWGSLSSSVSLLNEDVAELREVAFLPAANGTRLVTADALFARLMINLSPFAFELPSVYLPFVKILKDLGLQDMLTLSAAKDLLLNLQKACGYQHLNPNELRAVMEILNFICDQIVEENTADGYNWKSEAIVPDDGCRLVHSASCVYVDSYGSRYVKCIDTSRIRFVHPDLPERVCSVLGIKKLSDVVIEELDENQKLETLGSVGSVLLVTIRQKLSSKSLQSSVWTVVNSMGSYVPAFNSFSLDAIECLLNSTAEKLQFVKHLKTRFLLLPNLVDVTRATKDFIIPEWKTESAHQTLYFVNQSRSCILIAEPPTYISLFDLIAIVVSQVLGSPIILPIGSLFDCPQGSEIAVVNVLKLCSDKKEVEPMNGSSNMIGKEILPQDARLVQFHPLRPFYSGEIVAWRSQHGEKLKYGKVPEDVRPSAGQALYRFKIEVAPGVTQAFLSSQVFSFKSVSACSPLKETPVLDSPVLASNRPHVEFPESSGRGESYSQVQPLELVTN